MHSNNETLLDRSLCGCYKVQALITIDERGQMVLPKDVRQRAGIEPREKLALTTIERDGEICCMVLTKADSLAQVVQSTIGTFVAKAGT